MDMSLPYISNGGSWMPMALPRDFDIFCTPSRPSRMGVMRTICGFWPESRCSSRPHEQVELLVGAAEFDIALSATES